jgi:hypothetical protein
MRRARVLAAVCLTAATAAVAGLLLLPPLAAQAPARPPDSPRRLAEVSLDDLPKTISYRGRPLLVRYPGDPGARALGGSGGPIVEIEVPPAKGSPPVVFEIQTIGLALVESGPDWPAFENWSNAGGGTYTRAVYTWRPHERRYCAERVDEFEDHGDETAAPALVRIAGRGRLVRFARSRPFGCE